MTSRKPLSFAAGGHVISKISLLLLVGAMFFTASSRIRKNVRKPKNWMVVGRSVLG